VQFYESESFLYEKVSRFVNTALCAGESAIVIAANTHREAIARRVNAVFPSADSESRFISVDADETLAGFMVDGWPDARRFADVIGTLLRRASANGAVRVRAFGEMVALLCAAGKMEAAVRLEDLWNDLARDHDFSLLCAYPMEAFQGERESQAFHRIFAAHSHVCASEEYVNGTADSDQFHRATALLQQKTSASALHGKSTTSLAACSPASRRMSRLRSTVRRRKDAQSIRNSRTPRISRIPLSKRSAE
jgi:hypothetical protein